MAEEETKEKTLEEKESQTEKTKQLLKTTLKIILGVILILLGLGLIWIWRLPLWTVIRGCLGPFLILAGVITLAIAKE